MTVVWTKFRKFIWPFIVLTPQQMAKASEVDRRRNDLARKFNRVDGNKGKVTAAERLRGVQAELAAKMYFDPIWWNEVSEKQILGEEADLQVGRIQIDVKSIRDQDHQLAAYKIRPDWAYLLVLSETLGEFWLCGFMWGHELNTMPLKELRPGRPAHCAVQSRLLDPAKLRNAVYANVPDVSRP